MGVSRLACLKGGLSLTRSTGVYEESEDEDEADERFERSAHAGSYIAYHARKQLAFDLWWLVLALWLICIIERNEIANTESATWFNQLCVPIRQFTLLSDTLSTRTARSFSKSLRRMARLASAWACRIRRRRSRAHYAYCRSVRVLFIVAEDI